MRDLDGLQIPSSDQHELDVQIASQLSLGTVRGRFCLHRVRAPDGRGLASASIEPKQERQLVEVFGRFSADRDAAGSVRLGLWIVQTLVEAHGGEVADEDADPGARFVWTLPAVPPVG